VQEKRNNRQELVLQDITQDAEENRFSAYANPKKTRKATPKSAVFLAAKRFYSSSWVSPCILGLLQ
jgi:hypothetical protein